MNVPGWFEIALLAAAAWRIFNLIARDDILDRPRAWALRLGDWKEGQQTPTGYRAKWGEFITCPYCAGFWIVVLWWIAWQISEHWTLVFAVPWALSAALVGLDKILRPDD